MRSAVCLCAAPQVPAAWISRWPVLHQVSVRAPSIGIRTLCSTESATQQLPPTFWATGRCTGLHMALDTRRPQGQRSSLAGRLRRSVGGGGPEEAQLLQVDSPASAGTCVYMSPCFGSCTPCFGVATGLVGRTHCQVLAARSWHARHLELTPICEVLHFVEHVAAHAMSPHT